MILSNVKLMSRDQFTSAVKNLSLVLFSVALSVLSVEFTLRFFDLPPYSDHLPAGIYQSDNEIGTSFAPNKKDYHSAYEFKVEVDINEMGLRDHKNLTATSVPFAFAIGDSFIEGTGLDIDATIPKKLEVKLGKSVANLGLSSIGTREEIYLYENYLSRFKNKPKIAILFFYVGNDYFDNAMSEHSPVTRVIDGHRIHRTESADKVATSGNTIYLLDKQGKILSEKKDNEFHPRLTIGIPFLEQTKIYNILVNSLPMSGKSTCAIPVAIPGLFDKHYDWDKSVAWRETRKWISRFDSLSKESGVVPMVVIIPAKYQVIPELLRQLPECGATESIDTDASVNMLRGFLDIERIKYLDMTDEIRKSVPETDRQKLYFVSDSHLTPSGADFVAGKVFSFIKENYPLN
jgi:hypothetical protein